MNQNNKIYKFVSIWIVSILTWQFNHNEIKQMGYGDHTIEFNRK